VSRLDRAASASAPSDARGLTLSAGAFVAALAQEAAAGRCAPCWQNRPSNGHPHALGQAVVRER